MFLIATVRGLHSLAFGGRKLLLFVLSLILPWSSFFLSISAGFTDFVLLYQIKSSQSILPIQNYNMMQASISFLFKLLAIFSIFLLASTHPTAHSSNQLQSRATVCNGDSSLCERLYSNVTYIGTHNSYGIAPTSSELSSSAGSKQWILGEEMKEVVSRNWLREQS